MNLTILDNLLWAAGFIGHVALLFVLLVRRRWREFPVFTAMVAYQAMVTAVLFLISRYSSRHAYFLAYWTLAFGDYSLQIAIVFEMARTVLRPTGTWVSDARRAFLLWSVAGLVLAGAVAITIGPPAARGLDLWEVRTTLFTDVLTLEVFLAMTAAANRLGLQWRSHVMALGQGLTAWAVTGLLRDIAHVILGWSKDFIVYDHITMLVYLGSLVFWIAAFWIPERHRAPLSTDMQDYLLALHRRVQYDLTGARR